MADTLTLPDKLIDIHNHLAADDPVGNRIVGLMDARNVEMTLIMGTNRSNNADVLRAVEAHPDRLAGGVYIDPREGQAAIEQLVRYHGQGVHLVKLFPNRGYFPDEDRFLPVFDRIAGLGMGVLSHCGWLLPSMGVTAAYYSQPGRFEKLARTYGDTVFIMAHMGGIDGFLQTIMLATRAPNVYTDCSPGQGVWVLECAAEMAASIPADKIMWGMDCYYDEAFFDRQRLGLQKAGFASHAQEVYYSNARGLLQKIGALPPAR